MPLIGPHTNHTFTESVTGVFNMIQASPETSTHFPTRFSKVDTGIFKRPENRNLMKPVIDKDLEG